MSCTIPCMSESALRGKTKQGLLLGHLLGHMICEARQPKYPFTEPKICENSKSFPRDQGMMAWTA
jgi:hypothetical protein